MSIPPSCKWYRSFHHFLPRRSVRHRSFISPSDTAGVSHSNPPTRAKFLLSFGTTVVYRHASHQRRAVSRRVTSRGASHAFRNDKKAKRMPTTSDALRINAKTIRSPSGRMLASPSPVRPGDQPRQRELPPTDERAGNDRRPAHTLDEPHEHDRPDEYRCDVQHNTCEDESRRSAGRRPMEKRGTDGREGDGAAADAMAHRDQRAGSGCCRDAADDYTGRNRPRGSP